MQRATLAVLAAAFRLGSVLLPSGCSYRAPASTPREAAELADEPPQQQVPTALRGVSAPPGQAEPFRSGT